MDFGSINPILLVASLMVASTPILLAAIGEMVVEKADERPQCAGAVVVFGLAEKKRAPPLEVAQVDVVAERGADDRA